MKTYTYIPCIADVILGNVDIESGATVSKADRGDACMCPKPPKGLLYVNHPEGGIRLVSRDSLVSQ